MIFANPYTGQVVEVHSPSVGDKTLLEHAFKSLDDDSCPGALKLGFTNAQMGQWWATSGGATENARGFTDLLLVRVSQPSSDLSSIKVVVITVMTANTAVRGGKRSVRASERTVPRAACGGGRLPRRGTERARRGGARVGRISAQADLSHLRNPRRYATGRLIVLRRSAGRGRSDDALNVS